MEINVIPYAAGDIPCQNVYISPIDAWLRKQVTELRSTRLLAKWRISFRHALLFSLRSFPQIQTILILPGNYTEQLNITRKGPIRLLGQTRNPRDQAANLVTVNWNSANFAGSGFNDNAYTSVLTVAPNLNASLTGSGNTGFPVPADTPFGNTDFRAYNIDFRNNFAPRAAGPSLAVSISRANAGFYYCGIYSFQVSLVGAVNFRNSRRSCVLYLRVVEIGN
jgi:hypothetical protein